MVIYRSFPATLREVAKVWFSKLPVSSIANFEQLSDSFIYHLIRGQCHKRSQEANLLLVNSKAVERGELEGLCETIQ